MSKAGKAPKSSTGSKPRATQQPQARPHPTPPALAKGKAKAGGLAFATKALREAARSEDAETKKAPPTRTAAAGTGGARKPKPGTRVGKKGLVLYVDPAVPPALRRLALEHNCDVQQMGRRALELLFAEFGRVLPGAGSAPPAAS